MMANGGLIFVALSIGGMVPAHGEDIDQAALLQNIVSVQKHDQKGPFKEGDTVKVTGMSFHKHDYTGEIHRISYISDMTGSLQLSGIDDWFETDDIEPADAVAGDEKVCCWEKSKDYFHAVVEFWPHKDWDINGAKILSKDYNVYTGSLKIKKPEDCMDACKETSGCHEVTYLHSSKQCRVAKGPGGLGKVMRDPECEKGGYGSCVTMTMKKYQNQRDDYMHLGMNDGPSGGGTSYSGGW